MWASKIVVNLTQLNYDCATENTHEMRENTVALPGFMIGQEKQLAGNQVGIEDCGKLDSTYLTTTVTRKTPTKTPMKKYPRKHCGVAKVYNWTRKTSNRPWNLRRYGHGKYPRKHCRSQGSH